MALVVLTSEARRQAENLPMPIFGRMTKLVERLRDWPRVSGAKPLSGRLAGRFRLRTGDYRLQFRVEGETIVVEKIGHRDRFYED
jgi:mRNA-degrading endonuclease RelE of RelBE toxin-antitoxin system